MTDPTVHELDDHIEDSGPIGGQTGGFYTELDDGARIRHIPDDGGWNTEVEYGFDHPADKVDQYAAALRSHLSSLEPVEA
jgi:hypothetical protein